MENMIKLNSRLYLKRLAREVRKSLIKSVYWDSGKNGAQKIKIIGVTVQEYLWAKDTSGQYHRVDTLNPLGGFYDENGMEICASRIA